MAVAPGAALEPPGGGDLARVTLADGASTAVYVAAFAAVSTELRVAVLRRPERLATWCARRGIADAIVGGFFVRPGGVPLGEVRTRGVTRRHVAFTPPWGGLRACVHVEAGDVRIARRDELPALPRGDLLQAGPLLVRDGRSLIAAGVDPEGFSAGQAQFDSDITVGRYPRAALGVAGDSIWAVVCDGRAADDAALSLGELAQVMGLLGARRAVNLDGGGSSSLVSAGRMVNRPREEHGIDLAGGRPIVTALAFSPRP